MPGNSTQRATLFVAVSITARRGLCWSEVKAQRSSIETAIRCVSLQIGITARVFREATSRTETVPGPTFAVYILRPSWEKASMWDSGWLVGIEPTILFVFGSIIVTALASSVEI